MHATARANENAQGMQRGKQASGIPQTLNYYGIVHLVYGNNVKYTFLFVDFYFQYIHQRIQLTT